MEDAFLHFYSEGLASNTKKCYTSGQKRFLSFCSSHNLLPYPPSEHTILLFISQLGTEGLAISTIRLYLSAIRNLLISLSLPLVSLHTPKVELVLRGIKRVKAFDGSNQKSRLPITPSILLALKQVWCTDTTSQDNHMLWAAACLGFFGFLRCAEFTIPSDTSYNSSQHLSIADISASSTKGISSASNVSTLAGKIKQSKTDPFGKGVTVYLQKTGKPLCPVTALMKYLQFRGPHNGPLFLFQNKKPLTRVSLVLCLRKALKATGIDDSLYAGHSFRIGAATTALKAGISDSKIKMLGRWESSAYQLYIRTSREELASVSSALAN